MGNDGQHRNGERTIGDPLVAQFPCHTCRLGSVGEGIAEEMRSLSASIEGRSHVFGGEDDVTSNKTLHARCQFELRNGAKK